LIKFSHFLVVGFGILDNHFHDSVRIDDELAKTWSPLETI
jgi:hypothetical protein